MKVLLAALMLFVVGLVAPSLAFASTGLCSEVGTSAARDGQAHFCAQRSSGHGIDIVARNKAGDLVFFEVKTNSARLSEDQSRGADDFVNSRLNRAANKWKSVHDPNTKARAQALIDEIDATGGAPTGKVMYVDLDDGNITETPW